MTPSDYRTMVRTAFDEASKGYDCAAMRFFDSSAAQLVDLLPLRGDECLLDVATGTGKVALLVAERLTNGRVTGVDLSEGMIHRAQVKAHAAHRSNVDFQAGDALALNFPEKHFDGLTCSFGVFFWADMEQALKKLLTLVKPGGFVAVTSFAAGSFRPLSDLCLGRFEKYGVQLPKTYSWEKLDHPEKHEQLLKKVGLQQIQSSTAQMGYYLASASEWWDVVNYSGYRGFLNQLAAETAVRYKEEHLSEIALQATDKGIDLNVKVIFTTALKPE